MAFTSIILLIILGVVLILLEIFVIPGATISGIGGLILLGTGVYFSYDVFGTVVGHYTLLGAILFIILIFYYALRSGTWKRVSLNKSITSKIESIDELNVKPGDLMETKNSLCYIMMM